MLTAVSEIKNAITATEQAYKTNAYRKNSYYKMRNVMNLTRENTKTGWSILQTLPPPNRTF